MKQATYVTLCLLLALVVPAQAALVIEDGNDVSDWESTATPGWNVISSDATDGDPAPAMKVVTDSGGGTNFFAAVSWLPAENTGLDWSSYTSLEIDFKTSVPTTGLVFRFNIRNGDDWHNIWDTALWVENVADTAWHHYSLDISGVARDNVNNLYLYLPIETGRTSFTSHIDNIELVPEPATMVLLMLGMPLALRRRRR